MDNETFYEPKIKLLSLLILITFSVSQPDTVTDTEKTLITNSEGVYLVLKLQTPPSSFLRFNFRFDWDRVIIQLNLRKKQIMK